VFDKQDRILYIEIPIVISGQINNICGLTCHHCELDDSGKYWCLIFSERLRPLMKSGNILKRCKQCVDSTITKTDTLVKPAKVINTVPSIGYRCKGNPIDKEEFYDLL
jgi:hypothetical protein